MPSSFSTDLKLELMVTGENAGTWGTKTNTNLNLLQQAIAGFQSISIAGGAQTTALTMDNAAISNARNAVIKLTGTITGNQIVTVPSGIEKTYIVSNGTTGAFTVEFKTASGTGPTFSTTDKGIKILFADGTNIVDVNANLSASSFPQINDANGNEEIKFTTTASAVNELTIANAATGTSPTISATGSDTNVGINLTPKGTGGIVLPAGAVGTPALTTSGDLNTGIFFPSADTIAFTEGGSEAMRINSDGFVGIGTNSIESLLDVRGANKTVSSQYGLLNIYSTDAFAINKGGSITFGGKYATDGSFNQFAGIAGRKEDAGDGSWAGYLQFVTGTTPTERMRIDNSGNVLIAMQNFGATPSASNFGVSLNNANVASAFFGVNTGVNNLIIFGNPNGQVGSIQTNGSATSYNTSSDYRLKENVNYNFDATTRLKQLKPARFNFIADANKTVDGFLAHEVSDIIPEAIHGIKDETEILQKVVVNSNDRVIAQNIEQADWEAGKILNEEGKSQYPVDSTWEASKVVPVYQGIDQAKLTPLLTKALQEAIAKIEQLEARLTALES